MSLIRNAGQLYKELNKCYANSTLNKGSLNELYDALKEEILSEKSKQIKKHKLDFSQVDQISLFKTVRDLYKDLDFIEKEVYAGKEPRDILYAYKIPFVLDEILKKLTKNFEKEHEKDPKYRAIQFDEGETLYDRLDCLTTVAALKDMYLKDIQYLTPQNVRLLNMTLHVLSQTEDASKVQKFLIDRYGEKTSKDLLNICGALSGNLMALLIFSPFSHVLNTLLGAVSFGAITSLASSSTTEVLKDKLLRNLQMNAKDQDFILKSLMIDIDSIYAKYALKLRCDTKFVEALRNLNVNFKTKQVTIKKEHLNLLEETSNVFKELNEELHKVEEKIQERLEELENDVKPELGITSQEYYKIKDLLSYFSHFSNTDKQSLRILLSKSDEYYNELKKLTETNLIFDRKISSIPTYAELKSMIDMRLQQQSVLNDLNLALGSAISMKYSHSIQSL